MVKINFADIEEYVPLPTGKYHFAVSDGEVKQTGPDTKNPDSDFWSLECTVQEGEQEGKTQYLTVMLPPYEPFTLANLMRATVGQHDYSEEDVREGEFDVELDDLIGLEFQAKVRPQKGDNDYTEMRSITPYDSNAAPSADDNMLP